MAQKLCQVEPQRARVASENAKLQCSITKLERERDQARAVVEELKVKLDGAEDSLNQTLTELESSKTESRSTYQQGYNEGINTATESYKAQMPTIQDEIWAAARVAGLTKAGVSETSPLLIKNDLPSSMTVHEEEHNEEEDSLDKELNAEITEQTADDAIQNDEDVSNPGHKEVSGGNNANNTATGDIPVQLSYPCTCLGPDPRGIGKLFAPQNIIPLICRSCVTVVSALRGTNTFPNIC